MTGVKILEGAAYLMGFESVTEGMEKIGLTVINFVLEDLGKKALESLEDTVLLSEALISATLSGTAMLLSVALGDMRAKECFSVIYNEKRSHIKCAQSTVADTSPKGELL